MFTSNDIQNLRKQGTSNREIMEMTARVIPAAGKALRDMDNDRNTPDAVKDQIMGRMIEKNIRKGASTLPYVNNLGLNAAQRKYDDLQRQYKDLEAQANPPNPFNPFSKENQKTQRPLTELPLAVAETLPVIGGFVGGVAGAPMGKYGSSLGSGIGAGIGQIGLDATKRLYGQEQQPSEMITQPLKTAAIATLSDYGGQKIIGAGKKVLSPFLGSYSDDVAKIASKRGVDLPASALSESNVVRMGENIAAKGFTGKPVQEIVENASQQIVKSADDVVSGIGGSEDALVAGKSVIEGAEKFRKTWQASKNKLYAKADVLMNANTTKKKIDLRKTLQVLDNILGKKESAKAVIGDSVSLGRLDIIRKNLKSGKLTIGQIASALDEIGNLTSHGGHLASVGDEAALKKVAATLSSDLDRHIGSVDKALGKALVKADDYYADGINLLQSKVGDTVAKLTDSPEKIVSTILKPNSSSDVGRFMKLISNGKDGAKKVADVRTSFARQIIKDATGDSGISGARLSNSIKRYGNTFDAVFDKEQADSIREIAKIASALDKGQAAARGSQTAYLTKMGALVAAAASGNFHIAAGLAAQDYAFSKIFSTEIGRKWLTKGLADRVPNVIKSGAGTAIRLGSQILGNRVAQPTSQTSLSTFQSESQ